MGRKNREHLFSVTKKEFEINWFSGSGAGGQHRNKHQNCCRIKHIESGAMATGQSNRSRQANLKEAFNGLANNPKFKVWLNMKIKESLDGKSLEERVKEMMTPENLRVECRDDKGRWVEFNE